MFWDARGLEELSVADKERSFMTTNSGKAYTPSYLSQYLSKMIKETNLPFLLHRLFPV